ncbi:MAG: HNH endonuclease [Elusimicrobiales bacterium]|nr:HNH endonuclease [Elusimicrobiales bacterium]
MSAAITLLGGANAVYAATYSGTVYSGTKYGGTVLEPVYYNGVALRPISYGGTVIEGVVYNGIDLKHHKVTVHTITGNETSDDFFDSAVPEEYRIDWKKVIGKFAIGTTIIVLTGIVSSFVPGASGFIAATKALEGATSFAAVNSIIEVALAKFNGEPKKAWFKKAVEGASDGFMWGAMTAAVATGVISWSKFNKLKPLLNSKRKASYFLDEATGIVYGRDAKEAGKIMSYTDIKGEYKFFYNTNGNLSDFNGRVINSMPIQSNGIIKDSISGKEIAYIDSKEKLHTTKTGIASAKAKDIRKVSRTCQNASNKFVPCVPKTVKDSDGVKWQGSFPEFNSVFELDLPRELHIAKDKLQFEECNKQLWKWLQANPKEKLKFTPEQLSEIADFKTPSGYTWHHKEYPKGRMQLVDTFVHSKTPHTGGKKFWGGGSEFRR